MTSPDIAQAELDAGRGMALPGYVNEVLIARWLGITPWELQNAPIDWYQKIQVVIQAEHAAQEKARGKK